MNEQHESRRHCRRGISLTNPFRGIDYTLIKWQDTEIETTKKKRESMSNDDTIIKLFNILIYLMKFE